MSSEDAAQLIDDTLDLVHQRQTVDGDRDFRGTH
jgi:hypothetical protein